MIYVVEDNDAIRETICSYLELSDYEVEQFSTVASVVESLEFKKAQLCILDVMLPDGNGFELAKRIRESHSDVAFLFLTAKESESDRILGLELGAEDYIVKPFSPRELVLRVQAILRRLDVSHSSSGGEIGSVRVWRSGEHSLTLNKTTHTVFVQGQEVYLTKVEWKILDFLSSNPEQLISRERILGECLDYLHDGSDRTVNTHLKNLRSKLGDEQWIETVRGFGYKWVGEAAL
jgi:two-component system phosphate regulon response regulator PhoB